MSTKKWIAVKDCMPLPDVAVLVSSYGGKMVYMDALFDNGKWIKSEGKDVTHWMSLPQSPVEESDDYEGARRATASFEILAEQMIDQIITSGLCHAECAENKEHGCIVVWSGGVVEQLAATLAAHLS